MCVVEHAQARTNYNKFVLRSDTGKKSANIHQPSGMGCVQRCCAPRNKVHIAFGPPLPER